MECVADQRVLNLLIQQSLLLELAEASRRAVSGVTVQQDLSAKLTSPRLELRVDQGIMLTHNLQLHSG